MLLELDEWPSAHLLFGALDREDNVRRALGEYLAMQAWRIEMAALYDMAVVGQAAERISRSYAYPAGGVGNAKDWKAVRDSVRECRQFGLSLRAIALFAEVPVEWLVRIHMNKNPEMGAEKFADLDELVILNLTSNTSPSQVAEWLDIDHKTATKYMKDLGHTYEGKWPAEWIAEADELYRAGVGPTKIARILGEKHGADLGQQNVVAILRRSGHYGG